MSSTINGSYLEIQGIHYLLGGQVVLEVQGGPSYLKDQTLAVNALWETSTCALICQAPGLEQVASLGRDICLLESWFCKDIF